jgi:hypothetical protein
MRKLRIFLVELVFVPLVVGWLLVKAPDMFDVLMPWIVTAIAFHLAYECVLESNSIKTWRGRLAPKSQWIIFSVASVILGLSVWFGARRILDKIAKSSHPVVIEDHAPHPSPTPAASQSLPPIIQIAKDVNCSNIVAKDLKIKCEIEQEKKKEGKDDKTKH